MSISTILKHSARPKFYSFLKSFFRVTRSFRGINHSASKLLLQGFWPFAGYSTGWVSMRLLFAKFTGPAQVWVATLAQ